MGDLSRIGVAIDSDLLAQFDEFISTQGYTNRSEAFRDLIRDRLIRRSSEAADQIVVGTVTLIYDHHVRLLPEKLTELQHAHHEVIVSTLHVHLDRDNCLEVIIVKGMSPEVRKIGDLLISAKGVKHGEMVVTVPEIAPHKH